MAFCAVWLVEAFCELAFAVAQAAASVVGSHAADAAGPVATTAAPTPTATMTVGNRRASIRVTS
jgi:hypothetical protein